jgi:hypothetical protein
MSSTLRAHIRSNVVGYVALFCFVVGGTAMAAKGPHRTAPRNSVVSKSIRGGAVRTADLADGAVNGSKLADGAVNGSKLADGAVDGATVSDGSLTAQDLAPLSIDGADVVDGSLTGADLASPLILDGHPVEGTRDLELRPESIGGTNVDHDGRGAVFSLSTEGLGFSSFLDGNTEITPIAISVRPFDGGGTRLSDELTMEESFDPASPRSDEAVISVGRDESGHLQLLAQVGDGAPVVLAEEAP